MAGLPPRQCALCSSRDKLLRFTGCQVVYYCGQLHLTADWKGHKGACAQVKKTHKRLAHEERQLREAPSLGFGWTWDTAVGKFWGIVETRDYMRARLAYADAMLLHDTVDGVERAVEQHLDMFRLCRGDNMGIRDITPHLLLRLGRDQEVYDFVKWWCIVAARSGYDWADVDAPYLDYDGEDAFEGVDRLTAPFRSLSHVVAVALLKIRLWTELRDVLNAGRALRGALPKELVDMIKARVVRSGVVAARRELVEDTDGAVPEMMRELRGQIRAMVAAVGARNEYMWPHILNPAAFREDMSQPYTMGSREEALLTLNYCLLPCVGGDAGRCRCCAESRGR